MNKSELAAIGHLREALKRMVVANPCLTAGPCHCPTCKAEHALSATCQYEGKDENTER